jgi:hypothetical protein
MSEPDKSHQIAKDFDKIFNRIMLGMGICVVLVFVMIIVPVKFNSYVGMVISVRSDEHVVVEVNDTLRIVSADPLVIEGDSVVVSIAECVYGWEIPAITSTVILKRVLYKE